MEFSNLRAASIPLMKTIIDNIFHAQRNECSLSIEKLSLILEKSVKSINNGIFLLEKLKIINREPNFHLYAEIFNKLNCDYSIDKLIFDKIIIYPLFNEYIFLLKTKRSDIEAALFLKHTFNLKTSEKVIKSTFNGWLRYYKMNIDLEPYNIPITSRKDMIDEATTILYIRKVFNENLSRIPNIVIGDLVEGAVNTNKNPDNSLTDTGRALENYLRLKYKNSINLRDCNGISQISNKLRKNKLITNKHNNIIRALGSIRSIGDSHGLDKEENKKWEVSKDSALLFNSLVIKIIKSIEDYDTGFLSF